LVGIGISGGVAKEVGACSGWLSLSSSMAVSGVTRLVLSNYVG
jgi:hypothetical protein